MSQTSVKNGTAGAAGRRSGGRWHDIRMKLKKDWILYVILFPTLLFFFIFRVLPIINMRLAF